MAWSPEQLSNARSIIQVGRSLGASDRDITIALMAAWQESSMRNLSYGDRDSVGLFQQRNAWGSRADRMDPVKSARMFFQGGQQGQRGLLDFSNRGSYSLGQAAQKVQVSAYPDAYDKWQDESTQLLKELGGSAGSGATGTTGTDSTSGAIPPADSTIDEKQLLDGLGGGQITATPTTPLGLNSPASADPNASMAAAAPGIESADKQPALMSADPSIDQAVQDLLKDNAGGTATTTTTDFGDGSDGGGSFTPGHYNLPKVKSYVVTAANELGGRFGIKTIGGYGTRGHETDHDDGKALDFMTRTGGSLAAFAEKNWKRLNIKYIIWNQHIWNPSRAGEGWRLMEDRGGDTENHKDHVHISFN